MNKLTTLLIAGIVTTIGITHVYAGKVTSGPKGGRILEGTSPQAEFFVEKDRTVSITFYDANLKPVLVSEQTVTAIAEVKDGKVKLEFEKKGDSLVSTKPLPEGNKYNVVVQLKEKPDSKVKNFRVPLNTEICGGCKLAEYACTCDE